MRKISIKIIPIILLLTLTVTPILSHADYTSPTNFSTPNSGGLSYDNPNKNSSNNPFKLNVQAVLNSNLLMAVVGCTGIVNKISKATTGLINKGVSTAKSTAENLNSVPTGDKAAQDRIDAANAQLRSDAQREECFNGIAYMLAKNQLTAMTKATMNWVSTGLNGNPLYIQNQGSFLNSLTGAITQREASWFPYNTSAYPYGRSYSRSLLNYQRVIGNFEVRMQSNLLNYIAGGSNTNSYSNNFAQGGWNGWLALTQRNQNNPLGFAMTASQKLADDKSIAAKNKVDEANRNQGFLDQRRCKATTKQQEQYANAPAELKAAQDEFDIAKRAYSESFDAYTNDINNKQKKQVAQTMKDALDKAQAKLVQAQNRANVSVSTVSGNPNIDCTEWETVTPGSVVKDKVSTYINSPERQLELADTLNESLNILFTTLISRFESQDGGLAGLSTSVSKFTNSSSTSASVSSSSARDSNGGLSGYVDITKDLAGIIKNQQDYIKAAQDALLVAPKVVPMVAELDYCIPGPNPSWQDNSQPFKDAYFDYLNNIGTDYVQANTPKWEKVTLNLFDPLHIFHKEKNQSFYTISLPNESPYQSLFPSDTFWLSVKNSNHDPLWLTSCNNPSDCYVNEGRVIEDPNTIDTDVIGPFTNWVNTYWSGYANSYKDNYGIGSPMQTEIIEDASGNLVENPKYLPMAQAGLAITKNLKTTADDIAVAMDDYKNSTAQANSNIYKLNQIKKEVDVIVQAAQARRKKARADAGLPAISDACLAIELGQ